MVIDLVVIMRNTAILQLTPDKGPGPFDQEKLQTFRSWNEENLNNGRLNLHFSLLSLQICKEL